jgi:acyl-CoA synthetase (AMP-forming)/AMP-acid ligase II
MAQRMPEAMAVAEPAGRDRQGKRTYRQLSFRELDEDSSHLAAGLIQLGATPGMRLVLMVRPGIDFISLVFAMFKAGVVIVLVDPGMGRKNLVRCLEEVDPEGFVAIPLVHAIRSLLRRRFPHARLSVTVGRRWFWGGVTLDGLRARPRASIDTAATAAEDPAAIIFTTGSTGPPKGVLYQHGNFAQQASEIQQFYNIQPGEIDLPGFPLFALFNCAMGVSTVIPDMDPTRPADVDPREILEAARDWQVTQAFGSPALWNTVGRYCEQHHEGMPSLRRVLSAGAPVPPHVLRRIKNAIHPEGEIHTPYGATESLPVASISATEVLGETHQRSKTGAGTCVGRRFPGIAWKVIRITDEPLATMDQVEPVPPGEIGELMVKGPVVTQRYVTRTEANAWHKVADGDINWHRIGDVGYLDQQERFWFCGRKAHRVQTAEGTLFTVPCEAIFNEHPRVYRSALVGVGEPGRQVPVIIVEPWPEKRPHGEDDQRTFVEELRAMAGQHELTAGIEHFLIHPAMPVDIRHNAKIFREQLAIWAANQLT